LGRQDLVALSVALGLFSTACSAPRALGSRVSADAAVEPQVVSQLKLAGQVGEPDPAPTPEAAQASGVPEALAALPLSLDLDLSTARADALADLAVDWASVDRMNHGAVSVHNLGSRWGMAMSSGQDRLEECEPTLALTQHQPGFSDTFLFVSATYRLSPWAHLIGSVTGVRIQDQALSEAVDDAEFSSATIGVYFQF
jgi:hypothetical protein